MKNKIRLMARAAFALVILMLSVANVQAADKGKVAPVEIKYLGSVDSKPVFEISINSFEGEDAFIALQDENGNTLYADYTKDKSYSRKIQLDNADLMDEKLTLTVRSKKSFQKHNFMISKNVRVVEEVAVERL